MPPGRPDPRLAVRRQRPHPGLRANGPRFDPALAPDHAPAVRRQRPYPGLRANGPAEGGGAPALGAVLAGGRGSRLGGEKATAVLAGRPLISYPLAAMAAAGLETFVVAKPDTLLPPLEVEIVREPATPSHPLTGIVAALRHAGRPVVVLACDMPFASPALLAALAGLGADRAGDPALAGLGTGSPGDPALADLGPDPTGDLTRAARDTDPTRDITLADSRPDRADGPSPADLDPDPLDIADAPIAGPVPTPGADPLGIAGAPLVVPAPGGAPEPLGARWSPALLPRLDAALADEEPLRRTVASLSPRLLSDAELARFGDPARMFLNVNDRDDLRRAAGVLEG